MVISRVIFIYQYYKYIAVASVFLFLFVAFGVEYFLVKEKIDLVLFTQFEDIEKTVSNNYITQGDTLWGENWFAIADNVSSSKYFIKSIRFREGDDWQLYRKLDKQVFIKSGQIAVQIWIALDLYAFLIFIYIFLPILIVLFFLGLVALKEYIHFKSWELFNDASGILENFSKINEAKIELSQSDKYVLYNVVRVVDFIAQNRNLAKSDSFTELLKIITILYNRFEQKEQQETFIHPEFTKLSVALEKHIK